MKCRITLLRVLVSLSALFWLNNARGSSTPQEPLMIILNEDNDHYFKLDSSLMTEAALRQYIDRIAETKITHFFMCPNGQRTSYDSKVDEPIWGGIHDDPIAHSWCINAGILFRKGIDSYAVWIEQCRKRKISPWITMRMNDAHGLSSCLRNYRNTEYWRAHPELRRVPETVCNNDWNTAQLMSFDYSKKEAYAHQLNLVRELLSRYDVDGFEVDWMRNPYLLTPGKEQVQKGVLTHFMHDVRTIADSCERLRNHAIRISVRVPTTPAVADEWGFEVAQWCQDGLIDLLVPTSFYNSMNTAIPVEAWRTILKHSSKPVRLAPGTDYHFAAYDGSPLLEIPAPVYYGWAVDLLYRKVDGLYFFNLPYSNPLNPHSALYEMLRQGFTAKHLESVRRRHPVTYADWPSTDGTFRCVLPCSTDSLNRFVIQTGKRIASGQVCLLIGLKRSSDVGQIELNCTLNRVNPVRQFTYAGNLEYFSSRIGRIVQLIFPLEALRDGENEVIVQATTSPQTIEWVELQIHPAKASEYFDI